MQGERILSFLASSIKSKRVEYIHVSSDGFKSMIGRNFTDDDSYTVVVCDDQFGKGLFLGPKKHVACQKRSRFASGVCILHKVRFWISLNLTFDKPLKLDPS